MERSSLIAIENSTYCRAIRQHHGACRIGFGNRRVYRPHDHAHGCFRIVCREVFRRLDTLPLEHGLFDFPQAAHLASHLNLGIQGSKGPRGQTSKGSDLIASLFLPSDGEYVVVDGMPRRLRLQYPDAIYHLMARGNGRQDIVCDDVDRDRLQEHLGRAAIRCSWRIYAFAIMPNHLHIVLKTPQPNLSRGMQSFLSGYANGWSRRHRFSGHVFQGRYRTELVEDETYLWTVTRYVHLNPVRGGLVEHPAAWAWSSYPGYAHRGRRLEWVAYDELLASWAGAFGGPDPAAAYRRM